MIWPSWQVVLSDHAPTADRLQSEPRRAADSGQSTDGRGRAGVDSRRSSAQAVARDDFVLPALGERDEPGREAADAHDEVVVQLGGIRATEAKSEVFSVRGCREWDGWKNTKQRSDASAIRRQ